MKLPQRQTPNEVVELIKDIIQDKVVCDVGCSVGNFMQAMKPYAKEVFGIEEDREWASEVHKKGMKVMVENIFTNHLAPADVYYCFTMNTMGIYLKAKQEGTKGTFIFGNIYPNEKSLSEFIKTLNPEVRGDKFKVYIVQL